MNRSHSAKNRKHILLALPPAIVERIDAVAQRELRSRTAQIAHSLKEWLVRSDSAAKRRERRENE